MIGNTENRPHTKWLGSKPVVTHLLAPVLIMIGTGCATSRIARESTTPNLWPVRCSEHKINSEFGDPRVRQGGLAKKHAGVDIKAPHGADVLAAAPGVVIQVGWDRDGYGNFIRITHDRIFETLYAHLSKVLVREGKRVRRGAVIGKVGQTGNATGPHLHYEVRKNGHPVDPLPYLP